MNKATQTIDVHQDECTLVLCECCYGVILEEDAEYNEEMPYCHHCIKEMWS